MNKVIGLLMGIVFQQNIYSQVVVSESLDKAIRVATQKNLTLREKQIQVQKMDLQRKEVWHKYIPTIQATGTYLYADSNTMTDLATLHTPLLHLPVFSSSTSSTSHGNLLMGAVTAKMVIFSGLQIPYATQALQEKQKGTQYLAEVVTDEIIQEIIVSFDQIKVLEAVQTLIDDSKKRLQTEVKRIENAIQNGLAISLDRDKIRLAQLELESKEIELEGNKKLIFKKINHLTGFDNTQIQSITHSFEPFLIDENASYSVENKSEIKALESFVKAQEFVLKKEKSNFLPQVMALGGVRYTSLFDTHFNFGKSPITQRSMSLKINEFTISPTWFVAVGAQWELFSGLGRTNKIKQAKLDILSIQSKLDDTREKLALLFEKNLQNYRTTNQKLSVWEHKVRIAQNNLDVAIKQYAEGLIDISERLSIENDYYKAVIEQVQGIQQQRQMAIEVVKTVGKLADYIIENNQQ